MTNPIYFINVWQNGEKGLNWREFHLVSVSDFKREFNHVEVFVGQKATVYVGFDDDNMTNDDLLSAASAFMTKGGIETTIDLVNLDVRKKVVPPKVDHPRQ